VTDPVATWICDVCHRPIESLDLGLLVWDSGKAEDSIARDFAIVHKRCDDHERWLASQELGDFADPNLALVKILNDGCPRPIELEEEDGYPARATAEWAEIARRLLLPNFERARLFFAEAEADGWELGTNLDHRYHPDTLLKVREQYDPEYRG
jgi:hypothetical protein